MTSRTAIIQRSTKETTVRVSIDLDRSASPDVRTGIGFFDHMLTALGTHSGIALTVAADGDLVVDDHHTVEDVALALGAALNEALGERRGIARFASSYAPLDESLARAVIDLSGRPFSWVKLDLRSEKIGAMSCENVTHFFQSFAVTAKLTLHLDIIRGENDHHRAEAAFKATALALRLAIEPTGSDAVPSTKGTL